MLRFKTCKLIEASNRDLKEEGLTSPGDSDCLSEFGENYLSLGQQCLHQFVQTEKGHLTCSKSNECIFVPGRDGSGESKSDSCVQK